MERDETVAAAFAALLRLLPIVAAEPIELSTLPSVPMNSIASSE